MPRMVCEVDLDAVRHNVRALRSRLSPRAGIMAVVKANAYGHGSVPVAKAVLEAGAARLAVATPREGLELRESGIKAPIQVLGSALGDEIGEAVGGGLILSPSSLEEIEAIAAEARAQSRTATVHLLLETGLGRMGFAAGEAVLAARAIRAERRLRLEGAFSHFACAERDDPSYTRGQEAAFRAVCDDLRAAGIRVRVRHLANSAGAIFHRSTHFNLVRPGIALYGLRGWAAMKDGIALRPALSVKSSLVCIKRLPAGSCLGYKCTYRLPSEGVIGAVPVGYHDGFLRALSNNSDALVGGVRVPVVGIVSMDCILLDLTRIAFRPGGPPALGEEVVLIGRQGSEAISAEEMAVRADTIAYELTCRMGARAQFSYVGTGDEWLQREAPAPAPAAEQGQGQPEKKLGIA